MKKIIALLLVVAMMLCLVACNGKDNDKGTPGSDGEPAAASNTLSVCLASEPDTIDPALSWSLHRMSQKSCRRVSTMKTAP